MEVSHRDREVPKKRESLGANERLVLMDALRGLALFGIFLVNLGFMTGPSMAYGMNSLWSGPVSTGTSFARHFLADGAFVFLFSMLFGAGFSIMMGRGPHAGSEIGLPAFYRRTLLIGVLGWLHVALLWWGDILMLYALAGALLPLFRACRGRTLIIWVALLLGIPVILFAGLSALLTLDPSISAELAENYAVESEVWTAFLIEGYRSAVFSAVAETRWEEFSYNLENTFFLFPSIVAYMLFGLWLSRHDRFRLSAAHDPFFRQVLAWALIPAVVGKYLYTVGIFAEDPMRGSALFLVGISVGGPAMGLVYFCLLRRCLRRSLTVPAQAWLGAAGRMALTNYLLQSLVASLLFYGYGLGFYGQVPPLGQAGLAITVFALQMLGSVIWLRRFRMGPLEWVLRRFTYLR